MALEDPQLLHVYRRLHQVYQDDLHIARPLVRMLQKNGRTKEAGSLALTMARRLIAIGDAGSAIGFIELCRQMKVDAAGDLDDLATQAKLSGSDEIVEGEKRVFPLIDRLSDQEALDFLRQGRLMAAANGRDIVRQGEPGRAFYLILHGETRVHVRGNAGDITVGRLTAGDYFGAISCLYRLPRTTTVTAVQACELVEFSPQAVRQLMRRSPLAGERLLRIVQVRLLKTIARSHPALADVGAEDRAWLAEASSLLQFEDGATIARASDRDDHLYLVLQGEARVCRRGDGERASLPLRGGEMFSLRHPPLHLTDFHEIVARGRCLVCRVPPQVFRALLNAYGGFEQWAERHGRERRRRWRQQRAGDS